MKRVGFLTSGGDCQALNATMRGVAKGLYQIYKDEVEIIGFEDGYKGLMYANYLMMKQSDFSGVLTKGGTMLGTSRQPFKLMRVPDENGLDKVELMKHTYYKLKLDALVVLGGNGSQKTANLLSQEGLNVIGLPKTIDNDLWGTDSRALWISPQTPSTAFTPPRPPMDVFSSWKSWDIRSAGSPFTRELPAARISS